MMNDIVQNYITGNSAVKIAESIENAVRQDRLRSGEQLPTVRGLAGNLDVCPATVASAYRLLQARGVVVSQGRRGTRISHRPVHRPMVPSTPPPNARNLIDGNPDRALLPEMADALAVIDTKARLYGESLHYEPLLQRVGRDLSDCGVATGELCVVSGAMDGMERVMMELLRPGDRVIVEDPGFSNIFELVMSQGLSLVPVAVDDEGLLPDELARACTDGAQALIIAPRAQNPTGAAMSKQRAEELRRILRRAPDMAIIEDDHAGLIADAPLHCLHDANRARWVHLRSFSKALNPDLRLAVMTGDSATMARVLDRLIVGERWVSHILQRIACALISDEGVRRHLREVTRTYAERRDALIDALAEIGVPATGASGYNVWVPVAEETATVQALLAAGWAVGAGERFRLNAMPAIRITTATLQPEESKRLAADLAAALAPRCRPSTV